MRKSLSILLILAGFLWLNGCSSTQEIVKKDGVGGVDVSKAFVEAIEGVNPNEPYYYRNADPNWLAQKRLDDQVWELEDNSSDYYNAPETEDSTFYIFQADVDDADNINKMNWLAIITKEPSLRMVTKDKLSNGPTGPVQEEAIAGLSDETAKKCIVRAVKLGPENDEYYNVNDRNSQETRFTISWDRDAFPDVQYLKQTKRDPNQATKVYVATGSNKAIIDVRKGRYIRLCWMEGNKEISVRVDPYKEDALVLEGLSLAVLAGESWLKIIVPPETGMFPKDDNNNQGDLNGDMFDLSRLKPMRYAKLENYVDNGYIRVLVEDMLKDGKIVNKEYEAALDWYVNDGAIGLNPNTGKVQGKFLTPPWLLKQLAPGLYNKYRNSVTFPSKLQRNETSLSQTKSGQNYYRIDEAGNIVLVEPSSTDLSADPLLEEVKIYRERKGVQTSPLKVEYPISR